MHYCPECGINGIGRRPISDRASKAGIEYRDRRAKLVKMAEEGQIHEAAVGLAVQLHFQILLGLDADYTDKRWSGGNVGEIRDDDLATQVREVTKSLAQAINQARGLERDGDKFADDMSDADKKEVVRQFLQTLSPKERKALMKDDE